MYDRARDISLSPISTLICATPPPLHDHIFRISHAMVLECGVYAYSMHTWHRSRDPWFLAFLGLTVLVGFLVDFLEVVEGNVARELTEAHSRGGKSSMRRSVQKACTQVEIERWLVRDKVKKNAKTSSVQYSQIRLLRFFFCRMLGSARRKNSCIQCLARYTAFRRENERVWQDLKLLSQIFNLETANCLHIFDFRSPFLEVKN